MWLGEQVNEYGIGNGISILIFTSIIARFPSDIMQTWTLFRAGTVTAFNLLIFLILAIIIVAGIIFCAAGEREEYLCSIQKELLVEKYTVAEVLIYQ